MESIFKKAGYSRKLIFPLYTTYVKEENIFYVFHTDNGFIAASFKEKKTFTPFQLIQKFNLSNEILELSEKEVLPFKLSTISISDIYLNLYELKPLNDDILTTKNGNKAVLLFFDSNITGYAYLDEDGNTNFVSEDFGFWSVKKENLKDKPIVYTSDLKNIIEGKNENYILSKKDYQHINLVIEKYDYKNILFDDDFNWFLGNIIHLNNNTPYNIQIFEKEGEINLFSNKVIKCLDSMLEYSQPFQNRYVIKNDKDVFEDIVNEINMLFNIVLNKKYLMK